MTHDEVMALLLAHDEIKMAVERNAGKARILLEVKYLRDRISEIANAQAAARLHDRRRIEAASTLLNEVLR